MDNGSDEVVTVLTMLVPSIFVVAGLMFERVCPSALCAEESLEMMVP